MKSLLLTGSAGPDFQKWYFSLEKHFPFLFYVIVHYGALSRSEEEMFSKAFCKQIFGCMLCCLSVCTTSRKQCHLCTSLHILHEHVKFLILDSKCRYFAQIFSVCFSSLRLRFASRWAARGARHSGQFDLAALVTECPLSLLTSDWQAAHHPLGPLAETCYAPCHHRGGWIICLLLPLAGCR